ncbi:DUF1489 family protein [Paracraurococcus ruber]|uniref:DUF1489 family protein n=1 Tax=Paracraurococcus ruber TaxID=77675 RepID=A0ABS1D6Z3_9PROT|nr:DUF1489 domain-containing protein [Paracraurococcus ruber]MBK1662651.1 hypothetical protein [Paracraurococcus ruber]TDG21641.1 DUF1489 family protein [Paracraurococcus ruber]
MLHLIKLSVGPKDVGQLREIQARRAIAEPPLRHQTRMMPKRAAEILAGGSIYWVVAGFLQVRQRILDIREETWDDGSACAGLVLDPVLVPVAARPTKPFQGWRYLEPAAAPPDVTESMAAEGIEALPSGLRRELQALGLL